VNVASLLAEAAKERPDYPAILFEGRTFSYSELDRLTGRFAHALRALGVPEGGVLAIFLESCPELVVAYLGALKAGVVPNVVNGSLRAEEVRPIVADSGAALLVTDPGRHDDLVAVRDGLGVRQVLVTGRAWHGPDLGFEAVLQRDGRPEPFEPVDLDPTALASLLYTSGTTGHPKGVMLTHRNILDNVRNFSAVHYTADTRLLIAAPLFHCWGLINGVLGTFAVGASALVIRKFQTGPVLDLIERDGPTAMLGVPTMYNYMAKSPGIERRDFRRLEFVLSAAAPMPRDLLDTIRRDWKVGYAESYGLTETSPVITTTHHSAMRPGSCGLPMGDTELKVVDSHGRALPVGEDGELWARGTAIAAGYYKNPEATAAVFTPDGWFRTGDVARIDHDGYVSIVDRLKDMINVGGEKVYPRDVEEVLHRHPCVADAVVIGVPDPDRGEAVLAYVVRKPGAACSASELTDYVRAFLADFKVPRAVEFIEEIPRSPSGKALRRLLR
jgi:long-chain acyl-CoA synthetase